MNITEIGQRTKQKYPQYANLSDEEVGQKVLQKYPQYGGGQSSNRESPNVRIEGPKQLKSIFPPTETERGGTSNTDVFLSAIEGMGKDVAAPAFHFANQFASGYPKQLTEMAGYEYPSETNSKAADIVSRIAGVGGAVRSPLNRLIASKIAGPNKIKMASKLGQFLARAGVSGAGTAAYAPGGDDLINPEQRVVQFLMGAGSFPAVRPVEKATGGLISSMSEGGSARKLISKLIRPLRKPTEELKAKVPQLEKKLMEKTAEVIQPREASLTAARKRGDFPESVKQMSRKINKASSYEELEATARPQAARLTREVRNIIKKNNYKVKDPTRILRGISDLIGEAKKPGSLTKNAYVRELSGIHDEMIEYLKRRGGLKPFKPTFTRNMAQNLKVKMHGLLKEFYDKKQFMHPERATAREKALKAIADITREMTEEGQAGAFVKNVNKELGALLESLSHFEKQASRRVLKPDQAGFKLQAHEVAHGTHGRAHAILRFIDHLLDKGEVSKATKYIVKTRNQIDKINKQLSGRRKISSVLNSEVKIPKQISNEGGFVSTGSGWSRLNNPEKIQGQIDLLKSEARRLSNDKSSVRDINREIWILIKRLEQVKRGGK